MRLLPGHLQPVDRGILVEQPAYRYRCVGCERVFRVETIPKRALCRSCAWPVGHDLTIVQLDASCRCGWSEHAHDRHGAVDAAKEHATMVAEAHRRLRGRDVAIIIDGMEAETEEGVEWGKLKEMSDD